MILKKSTIGHKQLIEVPYGYSRMMVDHVTFLDSPIGGQSTPRPYAADAKLNYRAKISR